MALTALQRDVCRLLAAQRKLSGESYVAGGVALNELLRGGRISRDVDVFHDTESALRAAWAADRSALEGGGFSLEVVRERPAFIEVVVRRGADSVVVEWSHDSAFRYFPLLEHPVLGLTLHSVDLATNKLLALVGRREPRDFVDVMACLERVQPLGLLAWAASGKDPGWSPLAIVDEAARTVRYTQLELDSLAWDGARPNAAHLSQAWHAAVAQARRLIPALPAHQAGSCVLDGGRLAIFSEPDEAETASRTKTIAFHHGSIRGAFPIVRPGT